MIARTLVATTLLAVALAGCFEEAPSAPPTNTNSTNSTNGTGNTTIPNGTSPPPRNTTQEPNSTFEPGNGTETFRPTGGEVAIDVDDGAETLMVTFAKDGVFGGTIFGFRATLTDANGTEVAAVSSAGEALTVEQPTAGEWTLKVEFQAPPTERVTATWEVK